MTELIGLWWVWIGAAVVLGIVEVLVPGYIFLGFAIGALAMGALTGFGLISLSLSLSVLLFALLSLAGFVLLRRLFGSGRGQVKIWDRDINDN